MKLKSAVTTYEISLDELKEHFAEQLKVDKSKIYVEQRERWSGSQIDEYKVFDGLKITVRDVL
jgi:hypothetical protein